MTVFLVAFGLGMPFDAAPSAIFAETVKVGVRGGFRPALAVQIGSLVGDVLRAVLGLAGIGLLLQLDALRVPIGLAGVAMAAAIVCAALVDVSTFVSRNISSGTPVRSAWATGWRTGSGTWK